MESVLVVLGSRERAECESRAAAAVRYLAQNPSVRIVVFSGHNGEAESLLAFARSAGLASDVEILLERQSRHTHDNAVRTREILSELGKSDIVPIVVTCPYHMPRALRTFRTQFAQVHAAVGGLWRSRAELRKFVRSEVRRIIEHGMRGHVDLGPVSVVLRAVRRCA